jgi:hypothetical protein
MGAWFLSRRDSTIVARHEYVFSVMFDCSTRPRGRRRPRSTGGEEIEDDDEDDYEEENAGNFVIVVVGSLMGEETRDEEIETMALNTYRRPGLLP